MRNKTKKIMHELDSIKKKAMHEPSFMKRRTIQTKKLSAREIDLGTFLK
jgi:hypothetical protein